MGTVVGYCVAFVRLRRRGVEIECRGGLVGGVCDAGMRLRELKAGQEGRGKRVA